MTEILLRRPAVEDVEQVLALTEDPLIVRFTNIPRPNSAESVRRWIDGEDGGTHMVIVDAADPATILGAVGLHRVDAHRGAAEIGYWIAAEHRGRGLASRAVALLAGWAIGEAGLQRVELLADETNTASRRVAEKAGFAFEGILRSYEPRPDGSRRDVACYALIA